MKILKTNYQHLPGSKLILSGVFPLPIHKQTLVPPENTKTLLGMSSRFIFLLAKNGNVFLLKAKKPIIFCIKAENNKFDMENHLYKLKKSIRAK